MTFLDIYKKFRKGALISLVCVEIVLTVFIYLESTAYFGVYDIFEILITFALIFYVFMLSNDLEDYENNEVKHEFISYISPTILLYINKQGDVEVINGRLRTIGLVEISGGNKFKSLFSAKEWEKLEHIASTASQKHKRTSGIISFINDDDQMQHVRYIAQIVTTHKMDGLLVWMFDLSEFKAEELNLVQMFHRYRMMSYELDVIINKLPLPIWRRDKEGKIIFYNQAYLELLQKMGYSNIETKVPELDRLTYELLNENNEEGQASLKKVFIIENQPLILRINEIKVNSEGSIGYCSFINEQEQLEKNVASLNYTLENLLSINTNAVLIINNLGNVAFYNSAFIKLFDLNLGSSSSDLTFSSLLDKMREKGKLPEVKNYKELKWQQMKYITECDQLECILMHLPNGKTLRVSIIPIQGGNTVFHYEDISAQLTQERLYNEQVNVLRSVIASYDMPVIIFAQDGSLQMCNQRFQVLFDFKDFMMAQKPDFNQILELQQKFIKNNKQFEDYKTALLNAIDTRAKFKVMISFEKNTDVEANIEPLPDNTVMIRYKESTIR